MIPDKIINLLKTKQITKKNSNMYVQKVKKSTKSCQIKNSEKILLKCWFTEPHPTIGLIIIHTTFILARGTL